MAEAEAWAESLAVAEAAAWAESSAVAVAVAAAWAGSLVVAAAAAAAWAGSSAGKSAHKCSLHINDCTLQIITIECVIVMGVFELSQGGEVRERASLYISGEYCQFALE